MKATKQITITSKNQITIPADFVRSLNLHQDRTVSATLKNGAIVITPSKDLSDDMQKFWHKRKPGVSLTDKQINEAARRIVSERVAR